jgi:hypothetical protein
MAFTLLDDQKVSAVIAVIDDKGNPATLPTGIVPVWASSDATVLTVDASGDPTGMSAVVTAVGKLGSAQVQVTIALDASTTITGLGDVTVAASGPASVAISFGTPSPQ